jgi:hypothetical protein
MECMRVDVGQAEITSLKNIIPTSFNVHDRRQGERGRRRRRLSRHEGMVSRLVTATCGLAPGCVCRFLQPARPVLASPGPVSRERAWQSGQWPPHGRAPRSREDQFRLLGLREKAEVLPDGFGHHQELGRILRRVSHLAGRRIPPFQLPLEGGACAIEMAATGALQKPSKSRQVCWR